MLRITAIVTALLSCWSIALAQDEISVIPKPAKMEVTGGAFTLSPKTVVVANAALAKVLKADLGVATGYDLKTAASGGDNSIVLTLDAKLADELGEEGYKLSVTKRGVAIRAAGEAGLFYGIQTLRQLLPPEIYTDKKVAVEWTIPCVEITDSPRFEWRGMHLDVARHYMPTDFIRRYIDLMVIHKLNRFHLHLTDSPAWRIEIKKYPELTQKGSSGSKSIDYGKPMFYTQAEMREIVAYAAQRHIIVIPEIEVPGHSGAVCRVHPEWSAGGAINLQEGTISAFHDIFKEVMDVFPGPYLHVGGDEVRTNWLNNEADRKVAEKLGLQKDNVQVWLQGRLMEPILAAKRKPVMWFMAPSWLGGKAKKGQQPEQEEYSIPTDTVIMGWFDRGRSIRALKAGYDVVMNPKQGTYFDYQVQRDDPIPQISLNTLDEVYAYDPCPADLIDKELAHRVLGTQGQLWSERMHDTKIVENKSFPRTCALAEVAWTPQDLRDYKQFTGRMKTHYRRLDVLDVNYYRLKAPFTIIEEAKTPPKGRGFNEYEWALNPYLKGPGTYRMMFHVRSYFGRIAVQNLVLTHNGKPIYALDKGEVRDKHAVYDFELPEYDSAGKYVLKAEIKPSKGKAATFEVCIRKSNSPQEED